MPLFKVVVHGRGLWISLDDELQRVGFHVTRVVDAANATEATRNALTMVANDAKTQPQRGYPRPTLTAEGVKPASKVPQPPPGYAFYPDPE